MSCMKLMKVSESSSPFPRRQRWILRRKCSPLRNGVDHLRNAKRHSFLLGKLSDKGKLADRTSFFSHEVRATMRGHLRRACTVLIANAIKAQEPNFNVHFVTTSDKGFTAWKGFEQRKRSAASIQSKGEPNSATKEHSSHPPGPFSFPKPFTCIFSVVL